MVGDAKNNKLIHRLAYQNDLKKFLQQGDSQREIRLLDKYGEKELDNDFSGFAGMIKFMNLLMGQKNQNASGTSPQIAVVYVNGAIVPGKSSNTLMGNKVVGSETIIKALKTAEEEDRVRAIVVRVNSPGGSAPGKRSGADRPRPYLPVTDAFVQLPRLRSWFNTQILG